MNVVAHSPDSTSVAYSSAAKYLLFRLGEAQFGIDVARVREIVATRPLTVVPNSPPFLCGVINQRGRVVPVIDLRRRLEMAAREFDARTCLIVVESGPDADNLRSALAVDAVSEVIEIAPDRIKPAPTIRGERPARHLIGLARVHDKVTVLLDAEELGCLKNGDCRGTLDEHRFD